ncbi:MAG: hypothetical protein EP339_05115 [Gammaproteobacteria bacterium]|uniref:Uncharacterized protein n=1 Tax=Marinobacter nitratireducens TaxID=1137280 RepID=A0A072NEB2_9GAMM|nr:hypothetical protein [Marinobacter nitratireducens]KEF31435.1 hypothetical protein D777_01784 [Marinobacter nitratireducens]TNE77838.1 MAG: hypothetical protein EP339_05115 [Gammaproteobacteria bacterium]TNE98445.1 MAG: hypothetical protein EP328_04795 [Gammaproteobacteria bacterium]
MSDNQENGSPGTAQPAKIRKAACGIRFEEDELQEGIDFSGAADLKPDDENLQAPTPSARGKQRQQDGNP